MKIPNTFKLNQETNSVKDKTMRVEQSCEKIHGGKDANIHSTGYESTTYLQERGMDLTHSRIFEVIR